MNDGDWRSCSGGRVMISIGGLLAELAPSGNVVSRFNFRRWRRISVRVIVSVIASFCEKWSFFALVSAWPLSL